MTYENRTDDERLKLYLVTRNSSLAGYDEYVAFVVACRDEDEARHHHPCLRRYVHDWASLDTIERGVWVHRPQDVDVTYIGSAEPSVPAGIVISSFRAG